MVTILFPQEGMLNTLDHPEIIHKSEMVAAAFTAHTLQVMMMLHLMTITMLAMVMWSK